MATKTPGAEGLTEFCEACERETAHEATIELRTENDDVENAAFSREPYRIATCRSCGTTTARRMNDA
ncbi:MAG: hypothetical protein ABEH83_03040 [Halobacterium sp.]